MRGFASPEICGPVLRIFRQLYSSRFSDEGQTHSDSPRADHLTKLYWIKIQLEQISIPRPDLYHWSQWEIYYWLQWEQDWALCTWICKKRRGKHPVFLHHHWGWYSLNYPFPRVAELQRKPVLNQQTHFPQGFPGMECKSTRVNTDGLMLHIPYVSWF